MPKNIAEKKTENKDLSQNFVQYLNEEEKLILKKIYTLPSILQKITQNYKPHLLCNHLFEFSSMVNTWYAKSPVNTEPNQNRKKAMLLLCQKVKNHIIQNLELLGIEKIEQL